MYVIALRNVALTVGIHIPMKLNSHTLARGNENAACISVSKYCRTSVIAWMQLVYQCQNWVSNLLICSMILQYASDQTKTVKYNYRFNPDPRILDLYTSGFNESGNSSFLGSRFNPYNYRFNSRFRRIRLDSSFLIQWNSVCPWLKSLTLHTDYHKPSSN